MVGNFKPGQLVSRSYRDSSQLHQASVQAVRRFRRSDLAHARFTWGLERRAQSAPWTETTALPSADDRGRSGLLGVTILTC
jgi:hypothetical protein